MDALVLRDAQIQDSLLVLELRNASDVREFATSTEEIPVSIHQTWFEKRISNQIRNPFWIIEFKKVDVGYIRFDEVSRNTFEVSIAISNSYRGNGLGKTALMQGLEKLEELSVVSKVIARVHVDNVISKITFKKCGFSESGQDGNFLFFKL